MGYLTKEQRAQIYALLKVKTPKKEIASIIKCSLATVYREIKRGSCMQRDGRTYIDSLQYLPDYAQRVADQAAERKKPRTKLDKYPKLKEYLETGIKLLQIPPDILAYESSDNAPVKICTKTIYNYAHKGKIKVNVFDLPCGYYRPRKKNDLSNRKKNLGRPIEQRPAHINARHVAGHWEMDTVVGIKKGQKSVLLVLTERKTLAQIIRKIPCRNALSVVNALDALEHQYKSRFPRIFKTITCDNGVEFSASNLLERSLIKSNKLRTKVYFCHPYRSCERARNENQNRIIRRFFPKGTDFDKVTEEQVQNVENYINNLKRKSLGYKCAADVYCAI